MEIDPDEQLTTGILPELLEGKVPETKPILQLLKYRCLDEVHGDLLHRLTLSDGKNSTTFAAAGGELLDKQSIKRYSILQLLKYQSVNISCGKKIRSVILIQDLILLSQQTKAIGDPKNLDIAMQAVDEVGTLAALEIEESVPSISKAPSLKTELQHSTVVLSPEVDMTWCLEPIYKNTSVLQRPPPGRLCKVCKLKEEKSVHNWMIRVRVMNKMPVKMLFRGQVFTVDLADDTGMIKACAFDSECDRVKSMFQIGHAYWIANGQVRPCKDTKQGTTGNTFEIKILRSTIIEECFDTSGLPTIDFNFSPLSTVASKEKIGLVDICGICIRASEVFLHNGSVPHRVIILTSPPSGNVKVDVDIWGKYAEEFDGATNPVVVIKNCRVSQCEQKTALYLDPTSVFLVDPPNCPYVTSFKTWYADFIIKNSVKENEVEVEPAAIPATIPAPKDNREIVIEAASFAEAKRRFEAVKAPIVYMKCLATIIETDPQYLMTLTCTTCNKQVHDLNLEKLVCSNCGYVDGGNIRSISTRIRIGDESTNEWVHIADAQLKKAIGIPSNYMEGNSTQHWEAMCSLVGKQFYVQLKYDQNDSKFPCIVVEIDLCLENSMTHSQMDLS